MIDFSDLGAASLPLRYFEEVTNIPRGSGNTAAIADYLVEFAKARGLFVYRDGADNVVIRKPASVGFESRPTVIIQGHTDIVCEALADADIDMTKIGPRIYRDGDYLRAEGTTLGADDGVMLAYALALLDSADISLPEIEAVFTSDEEIGLIGAGALDCSVLRGKTLINIDSDEEGIFTVGCAGGVRLDLSLPITRSQETEKLYYLSVSGLLGGHSGVEIDKGRTNAIKLLGEALSLLSVKGICSIEGGNADNAIPREATALIVLERVEESELQRVSELVAKVKKTEPEAEIRLKNAEGCCVPFDTESSKKIIGLIAKIPSGVYKMSSDIEGLVETSSNLGIIHSGEENISLTVSLRSSKGEEKDALRAKIQKIAEEFSAGLSARGEYPGWAYRKDSHLRDTACRVFREQYGREPKVVTIHAGLECGLFSDKIDGLDCISLGPDNLAIHTPDEHLSLSSFMRIYEFLISLLKNI